jgi:hypothetical protein
MNAQLFTLLRSGTVSQDPILDRIQGQIPPFLRYAVIRYSLYIFLHNCGEKFVVPLQIDFPKQV